MDEADCIVIGAGVIGLACARALAISGRDVIVIERNLSIGMETSSRNSEVIHSGIYYPRASLKAVECVRGREMLYAYCRKHNIPHRKLGKLIVATAKGEEPILDDLYRNGIDNGVNDLQRLSKRETVSYEPSLFCSGSLWSPSTGIVDSHSLMLAMQGELEDNGGMMAFDTELLRSSIKGNKILLETTGSTKFTLLANLVVNCAGLNAQNIVKNMNGFEEQYIPPQFLARGNYFSLTVKAPFSHLIYPAPEPGGLGVHATLDLAGQCRFGPDVEWVEGISYKMDPTRADAFYSRIRKYWPDLKDGQLQPAYSGIRPKIVGPGENAGDFIIQGPNDHNSGPIINLFGMESPGLTCCLSIAEKVVEMTKKI